MAAAVWLIGEKARSREGHLASRLIKERALINHGSPLDRIRSEDRMYHGPPLSAPEVDPERTDYHERTLAVWYSRRVYPGSPPTIPHPVTDEQNRRQTCLNCHEKGGFASAFNAYTPVTPHPEYTNCMQCHVPGSDGELFRGHDWVSVNKPALHRPMLPGGPPPIPHTLQLRENCLSCHAGPAAPIEIRTTHPERINCRQCHVPAAPGLEFNRTAEVVQIEQAER